jgi:thiol:disulfide interchange protein
LNGAPDTRRTWSPGTIFCAKPHISKARCGAPKGRNLVGGDQMILKLRSLPLPACAVLFGVLAIGGQMGLLAQPGFHVNRTLYSETADAKAEIAAAEVAARQGHKRILLEFGANWCGDCQVLDYYYQQPPNAELLAKYYVVVRVEIGHMDHNIDIAEKYGVPIRKGVPALAVLNAAGKVLYAEEPKEFEHASAEAVSALLIRWKPRP